MKILMFAGILLFAFFLFLIVRFLVKRLILLSKLRKFAKENSCNCKITSPLFFIPLNYSEKGSVLIETEGTVYNIKVFGLLRSHCEVHFWNSREYSVKQYLRLLFFGNKPLWQENCHRRKIGEFGLENNENTKTILPILLFSPTNTMWKLTYIKDNEIKELRAGEKIDNILFADTTYLFSAIKELENK